jgi:hypothetical protein
MTFWPGFAIGLVTGFGSGWLVKDAVILLGGKLWKRK